MNFMRKATLVFVALLFGGVSCKMTPQHDRSEPWERMAHEHERSWDALRRIQREVNWQNLGNRITEVPGVGRIIVRDWRLLGAPGREYVRLFFTYENSSTEHIGEARVWANVRDGNGRVRASAWINVFIPWFEFAPGNTWTGELRVATNGAHFDKGWRWEVGAAASHDETSPRVSDGFVRTSPIDDAPLRFASSTR